MSYSVGSEENVNLTMSKSDDLFEAVISPQPYNASVSYLVYAWDAAGNVDVSVLHNCRCRRSFNLHRC